MCACWSPFCWPLLPGACCGTDECRQLWLAWARACARRTAAHTLRHKPTLTFCSPCCPFPFQNWVLEGRCPYSSRCQFAHGDHELRDPALAPPKGGAAAAAAAVAAAATAPCEAVPGEEASQCPAATEAAAV